MKEETRATRRKAEKNSDPIHLNPFARMTHVKSLKSYQANLNRRTNFSDFPFYCATSSPSFA
jgi:hypothetical protein